MDDEQKITAHLDSLPEGAIISDACARVAASIWHGAQSCPLYALASTGAIGAGTVEAIESLIRQSAEYFEYDDDERTVTALLDYVKHHGARGPVPGWSRLWL